MGQIKEALKRQLNEYDRQEFYGTSATILSYDKVNNVATIRFVNPNNGDTMLRQNVPLCITMGGLTGGCITYGQQCMVTFVNNNIFSPVITGITESLYNEKTCDDQGAYIVDSYILSCEKPENITPMSDSWIDYSNEDVFKYNNDLTVHRQVDAAAEVYDIMNTVNKYKDSEQGITNLYNKSTIKTKENGDIDIFAENNIGIRISPLSKRINIYGNLDINGEPLSVQNFKKQADINTMILIAKIEYMIQSITTNDLTKEQLKPLESLKEHYYSGNITIDELPEIHECLLKLEEICS